MCSYPNTTSESLQHKNQPTSGDSLPPEEEGCPGLDGVAEDWTVVVCAGGPGHRCGGLCHLGHTTFSGRPRGTWKERQVSRRSNSKTKCTSAYGCTQVSSSSLHTVRPDCFKSYLLIWAKQTQQMTRPNQKTEVCLPLTTTSVAIDTLSTFVWTAHVYFPACLGWMFRIIISPAERCRHRKAVEGRKKPQFQISWLSKRSAYARALSEWARVRRTFQSRKVSFSMTDFWFYSADFQSNFRPKAEIDV